MNSVYQNRPIAGIENDGNSCFIQVVLQELAHFPEVYGELLDTSMVADSDTRKLQRLCLNIIKNIQKNHHSSE